MMIMAHSGNIRGVGLPMMAAACLSSAYLGNVAAGDLLSSRDNSGMEMIKYPCCAFNDNCDICVLNSEDVLR